MPPIPCFYCAEPIEQKPAGSPGAPRSVCLECQKARRSTWQKQYDRNRYPNEADRRKAQARCYRLGVAPEDYEVRRLEAGGACGICQEVTDLVYDHDHATMQYRGFLCSKCNLGLGLFRDNTKFLRAAADYLEKER